MYKIKNRKDCALLALGVVSHDCFQTLCLETMRYFILKRCLKENMVSELRTLSVVCLEQKKLYQFKNEYQTRWCGIFDYELQTPLSVTILRTNNMGIGYPVLLAAVLNCHKSIWIMIQYHS